MDKVGALYYDGEGEYIREMITEGLYTMRSFRPDLVIENADGHPIAVVEVKSRINLSNDGATRQYYLCSYDC